MSNREANPRRCELSGCSRAHRARGLCNYHYKVDWHVRNPGKQSEYDKAFARKASEKRRKACRDWQDRNKARIAEAKRARYAKNPAKYLEASARWQKANREHMNALRAKRRAAKRNATPKWVNQTTLREVYKNCPKGYHVDHIIPLCGKEVCGLHVPWNLQYLTPTENSKKGNRVYP